mmetsp:Transcript_10465/g.22802  ORF Transcript_10465/g.22802 Transcript_10465/m.22802 type:complete len:331 (-) Transcript_10465:252-1244(-)
MADMRSSKVYKRRTENSILPFELFPNVDIQRSLLCCITNTAWAYSKLTICFRKSRRVKHRANSILPTTFPQSQPRSTRMRHDIASNRLGRILRKAHPIRIRHHLIRHEHRHSKLFRQPRQLPQKLRQLHLPFAQFSPPAVIRPVQRRGGVDDDERVSILGHDGGRHLEEFGLVFGVVGACVGDIFEGDGGVHSESFGDGLEALGAEGSFGVDVDGLALSPTLRNRHLARDTQRMTKLRLPRPKFPENLRQTPRLHPTLQQLIQFRTPGGQRDQTLSILQRVGGRLEIHRYELFDNVLELYHLGFRETADLGEFADGGVCDRFDGVEAGIV